MIVPNHIAKHSIFVPKIPEDTKNIRLLFELGWDELISCKIISAYLIYSYSHFFIVVFKEIPSSFHYCCNFNLYSVFDSRIICSRRRAIFGNFHALMISIIPILIILAILWKKKKLRGSQLKFIFVGIGVLVLFAFSIGITSSSFFSDEEKAQQEEDRKQAEWELIAAQKQAERDAYQQKIREDYFERTGKNFDDIGKPEKCEFDINWKQHTQTIYNTMPEAQYCSEFRDQLKLACSPEAKAWWTDMLQLWDC
jgi:hypothetical protein